MDDGLSPLLQLPVELRRHIYTYLLPRTLKLRPARRLDIVWRRGFTAIMAVNRLIYEETADIMYGENVFVLDVSYAHIKFWYRTLLNSGLCPYTTPNFIDFIAVRNVRRISRVIINVEHTDSYTGMIKYNCGGFGLTDGLRTKVQKLVNVLCAAIKLRYIHVNLVDWSVDVETARIVLKPFQDLHNVQNAILITCSVTKEFVTHIRS